MHRTCVRGIGAQVGGQEQPGVKVSLASRIPLEDCARLNLDCCLGECADQENPNVLLVRRAGETLYRMKESM